MLKYLLLYLFFFSLPAEVFALEYNSFHDARSMGIGGADVAVSSPANPASISSSEYNMLSMNYENKFGIKEISTISAFGSFFCGFSDIGIELIRFGYEYYNETTIGVNISRELASDFSCGVRFNCVMIDIVESETINYEYFSNIGMQWSPCRDLTIGVVIVTPVLGSSENILSGVKTGFAYSVLSELTVCCEFDKIFEEGSMIKFGMEYAPIKNLFFRTGMFGKPFTPTFGIGYRSGNTKFDLALQYHSLLGFSPALGFSYMFNFRR